MKWLRDDVERWAIAYLVRQGYVKPYKRTARVTGLSTAKQLQNIGSLEELKATHPKDDPNDCPF